jgi:hypothetical protein
VEKDAEPHAKFVDVVEIPIGISLAAILKFNGCVFAIEASGPMLKKTPGYPGVTEIGAL